MPTPREKARYAKVLDNIANRYNRLDDATLRRVIGTLQELRKDIAAALLRNPSDFELWRLTQLQAAVDEQIEQFNGRLLQALRQGFSDAANLGADMVTEPLRTIGLGFGFNRVDPVVANIITDFSAMLVKDISEDIRARVNGALRLAALGQETPFQVMKRITSPAVLGIKSYDGVWGLRSRPDVVKGVAARAEAITRTELTRVFNLAQTQYQKQAADQVPGLLKRWVATGDERTRPAHLMAHYETLSKPVPYDKPFDVGGEKMMYPGDPRASAGNTVNCRCRMVTVIPDVGVIETPMDRAVVKEKMEREG